MQLLANYRSKLFKCENVCVHSVIAFEFSTKIKISQKNGHLLV